MNFFGLTHLGPVSAYSHNSVRTRSLNHFSDDLFKQAFNKLDKDNANQIPFDQIRVLLNEVYQSEAPEAEVRDILVQLDNGQHDQTVSLQQLMLAVQIVKEKRRHLSEVTACEHGSWSAYRDDMHKHKRLEYEPHDKFRQPLTTSMDYGWYKPTKVERVQRIPNKSCAETLYASEMVKSGIYF